MTTATQRRGCSPLAFLGCGCGLIAGFGILLVFFILGIQYAKSVKEPSWRRDYYAMCQDNMRYLQIALEKYREDYHHLPAKLDDLRSSYLDSPNRLRCPLEDKGLGKDYVYTPNAKNPTDPLIICTNHGQGPIILQVNGQIRVPLLPLQKR